MLDVSINNKVFVKRNYLRTVASLNWKWIVLLRKDLSGEMWTRLYKNEWLQFLSKGNIILDNFSVLDLVIRSTSYHMSKITDVKVSAFSECFLFIHNFKHYQTQTQKYTYSTHVAHYMKMPPREDVDFKKNSCLFELRFQSIFS